jgi:hypothetical protein
MEKMKFFMLFGVIPALSILLLMCDDGGSKTNPTEIRTGEVTTFAGPAQGTTTSGDTDAIGNAASFNSPKGIATDGTNLYVADTLNHKIRKIVISTGVVTTFAGPAQGTGSQGDTDGTGNAASFNSPWSIATDGINLYLADTFNNKIRKIVQ